MKRIEPAKQVSSKPFVAVGFIIGAFSVMLYALLNGQSWTEEKIGVISQMVVQFDAFLTAGAAVGISVFWTSFANTIRKGSRMFQELVKAFNEMTSGSQTLDQDDAQRIAATERANLPVALLGIVFFVISAVLAVIGEMFDNIFTLGVSLDSLVAGTCLMFVSWYAFNFYGAELRRLLMDETELLSDIRRETAKRKKARTNSES